MTRVVSYIVVVVAVAVALTYGLATRNVSIIYVVSAVLFSAWALAAYMDKEQTDV